MLNLQESKIIEAINEKPNIMTLLLENGVGRIATVASTFNGEKLGAKWFENKSTIEELFRELTDLKFVPIDVWLTDDYVVVVWHFRYRVMFDNPGDFFNLFVQFQEFLDSIECLDLSISFDVFDYEGDSLLVQIDPFKLSKQCFTKSDTDEILFTLLCDSQEDMLQRQFWLHYDQSGAIRGYYVGDEGYAGEW